MTSNGLSSKQIREQLTSIITIPNCKVALVTTASVGYKEKDWNIPRLMNELLELGYYVECFDIDISHPNLLLDYDIVEFIGGNPYYLVDSLRKHDCLPILKTIVTHKIIIGISAGSLAMQKCYGIIDEFEPHMNDYVKIKDRVGMSLTDIQIFPHYQKFLKRYDNLENRIVEYEIKYHCSVIRLNDSDAIFIDENSITIIKTDNNSLLI